MSTTRGGHRWFCGYCNRGGSARTKPAARGLLTKHVGKCEARRDMHQYLTWPLREEEDKYRLRVMPILVRFRREAKEEALEKLAKVICTYCGGGQQTVNEEGLAGWWHRCPHEDALVCCDAPEVWDALSALRGEK
jgi:hypothetical protein